MTTTIIIKTQLEKFNCQFRDKLVAVKPASSNSLTREEDYK